MPRRPTDLRQEGRNESGTLRDMSAMEEREDEPAPPTDGPELERFNKDAPLHLTTLRGVNQRRYDSSDPSDEQMKLRRPGFPAVGGPGALVELFDRDLPGAVSCRDAGQLAVERRHGLCDRPACLSLSACRSLSSPPIRTTRRASAASPSGSTHRICNGWLRVAGALTRPVPKNASGAAESGSAQAEAASLGIDPAQMPRPAGPVPDPMTAKPCTAEGLTRKSKDVWAGGSVGAAPRQRAV